MAFPQQAISDAAPPDASRIVLRLLHAPRLAAAGAEAWPLPPKDAALLALLAIDGPTARARVAAMLWPAADADGAHNNLRQRLFRLRRAAGREVVLAGATLALAPGVVHDLVDARAALDDDPGALSGELLGACDHDDTVELAQWVRSAREQWRALRRDALTAIAMDHEKADRVAAALPYAERLVREEPLAEHAARLLMRLHYRRGDRSAALAAYERLRTVLDEQLGETPAGETQRLAALIEASLELPVAVASATPVAVLRPPRLIGRGAEWQQLEAAWAQHSAVVVTGEPGIGKSRLLADFADARRVGARACARPGDAAVPYALLARMLRALTAGGWAPEGWAREELARLLPELGAAPPGDPAPARLRQAAEAALAAAPVEALLVDDLQYGDAATLELLPALVAASATPRWLLALRSGEIPPAISDWLAGPESVALMRLPVGTLDAVAVQTLLESLRIDGLDVVRLAPALHRHTGGNPLFVLETLRAVLRGEVGAALPLPGSLEVLVLRRFDGLSAAAQRLARVGALAGQDFDAELAAAVLGVHVLDLSAAWAELAAAQLMRDGLFVHDLVAEAVSRSVPAAVARVLHRAIAAHLESAGGEPARVAHHWLAGGDAVVAGAAYLRAAERARRRSRRDLELDLLDRAAKCLREGGRAADAFDCARRAVHAAKYADSIQNALARADALVDAAASDAERAAALETRAAVRIEMQQGREALADAEQAAVLDTGTGELEVRIAQRRAMALMQLGRHAEARPAFDRALARVGEITEPEGRIGLMLEHATLLDNMGQRRDALAAYQRVHAEAMAHACLATAADVLGSLSISCFYLGRVGDALCYAEQARALGPCIGAEEGAMRVDEMNYAVACHDAGRYAQALEIYPRCAESLRALGYLVWAVNAENNLADLYTLFGQPQRARALLGELPDDAPPMARVARLQTRARIAQAQGQPALVLIDRAIAVVGEGLGREYFHLRAQTSRARELPPTEGSALCRRLLHRCLDQQYLAAAWPVQVALIDALLRAGDTPAALDAARALAAFFTEAEPVLVTEAEVWWAVARACMAAGADVEARRALDAGRTWLYERALPEVPELFHHSFLNGNPVNRELLAAAGRLR